MTQNTARGWKTLRGRLADFLVKPAVLACLPMVSLAGYWAWGEVALSALAAVLPLVYLVVCTSEAVAAAAPDRDPLTGLMPRVDFEERVGIVQRATKARGQLSAVFLVEVDDYAALRDRYGQAAADMIVKRSGERIGTVLRDDDFAARIGDCRFAGCLVPRRQLDLETCIQIAGRLQTALEEPIPLDGAAVYVTSCVGFCQHAQLRDGADLGWLDAAGIALRDAQHNGPGSIRAFTAEMRRRTIHHAELREDVAAALEQGRIKPWFQPQISTDTGQVTGFEALARWHHPDRGPIPPADFMPAIEQAGLMERLAEVMIYHSFTALKAWDGAGFDVPQIGVNFAGPDLANPRLVDKIRWELDRFDIEPSRFAVEVLETVVARAPDDVVTRNLRGLSDLGCRIDLDDFGTGHASLGAIRRFSIGRIKIDRSFVLKSDRDPEQQKMLGAILTMAERLGVETLAEGVESVGEHAYLSQLGCDHVQGFGIGKPMPFDKTLDWIAAHNARLEQTPRLLGNSGL
ncbi:bifunctional diguanylate cyclase/phosphodiesterase [Sulfitobacter sp. D35]|uniref:putative bifunctional diguanylate cyclase/phosphodiesterase n=1 Tax=Sulfitobacter sp. D35 TaxID=3083252 RepID=UPI00296F081E|nr:bifunctional diguanylate cyclase/phosphodiesterase [Sulfitobacter sp. D35]MDW4500472.1 bifunctional diguanylate cyclase/phosphodiesterase [Sulfitobacter sp. D35]